MKANVRVEAWESQMKTFGAPGTGPSIKSMKAMNRPSGDIEAAPMPLVVSA
jgi:hypothetical protein